MSTQGEKLKQIRQTLNLSQDEFGCIFGIQKQMVSSLEKDKLKLNNEKLEILCKTKNININWLLCGIGNMFNEPDHNKEELKNIVRQILKEESING